MRRVATWFLSTAAVVALLFGYHTSTSGPDATATESVIAAPAAGSTSAAGANTVTGSVAQTRWGPVQVQLAVSAGKITGITVVRYPDGNGRDQEINAAALPTLTAQSANIDMVSGATVTSDGYIQSLQSALDQAGLA